MTSAGRIPNVQAIGNSTGCLASAATPKLPSMVHASPPGIQPRDVCRQENLSRSRFRVSCAKMCAVVAQQQEYFTRSITVSPSRVAPHLPALALRFEPTNSLSAYGPWTRRTVAARRHSHHYTIPISSGHATTPTSRSTHNSRGRHQPLRHDRPTTPALTSTIPRQRFGTLHPMNHIPEHLFRHRYSQPRFSRSEVSFYAPTLVTLSIPRLRFEQTIDEPPKCQTTPTSITDPQPSRTVLVDSTRRHLTNHQVEALNSHLPRTPSSDRLREASRSLQLREDTLRHPHTTSLQPKTFSVV